MTRNPPCCLCACKLQCLVEELDWWGDQTYKPYLEAAMGEGKVKHIIIRGLGLLMKTSYASHNLALGGLHSVCLFTKEGTQGSSYILNHQKINLFPITSQPPCSTQFAWGTKEATMTMRSVCALKETQTQNGQALGCWGS